MNAGILLVAVTCLGIVMVAMSLLAGVCELLRRLGQRRPDVAATDGVSSGGVDPHLVVLLTAAASEALGAPVAVHKVHLHTGGDRWSRAGRMDIMDSHRIGPRR